MATDSFGTDGTPPPGWTADATISDPIAATSGHVAGTNFGTPGLIYLPGSSQASSEFLYSGGFFPNDSGPALRYGDGNCYYLAGAANLVRKDSGSAALIQTGGPGQANGDTLKITREGNDIVGYLNGAEILRATDTTYTGSCNPALHMIGPFAEYDDFDDGAGGGGGGGKPWIHYQRQMAA